MNTLLRPCTICKEREIVYVGRGLCRQCNDKRRGKLRWEAIKGDPKRHGEYIKKTSNRLKERRKNEPALLVKERARCKKWYANNKEYRSKYYGEYYNEKREYHLLRARERSFGGLYMKVIERDKYSCQHCGKKLELGSYLNVHHKDRDRNNNTMENLITVCPKCHQGYFHRDKYEQVHRRERS